MANLHPLCPKLLVAAIANTESQPEMVIASTGSPARAGDGRLVRQFRGSVIGADQWSCGREA